MSQTSLEQFKAYENTERTLIWESTEPGRLNPWTPLLREQILKTFWGVNTEGHHDLFHQRHEPEKAHRYDPFFTNFEVECMNLNSKIQERSGGRWICNTYGQLFGLLDFLRRNKDKRRVDCLEYFHNDDYSECGEQDRYDMIDLVVLLWLRVDVTKQLQPGQGLCNKHNWDEKSSLAALINRQFPERPTPSYASRKPTWTRYLRACSLTKCGYFRVHWTNRLEDHLFLEPYKDPPEIFIFHWATFLEDLSQTHNPDRQIFPADLIQETRDTLALLIPYFDSQSSAWFKKEAGTYIDERGRTLLDQQASQPPIPIGVNLVQHYKYWGERLDIIQTAYDEAEPVSFSGGMTTGEASSRMRSG